MKAKSLNKIMGRDEIERICLEKDWQLPTIKDVENNIDEIEHTLFWIEGYINDPDPETGIDELRPLVYNKGKIHPINKNNKINVVVMRKAKVCKNCGHLCD